jgi:hypothetical protein
MNRRALFGGLGILTALITAIAILFVTNKQSFKGSVITPPWPAADFTLTDHNGQPFSMNSQRGGARWFCCISGLPIVLTNAR